MASDGKMFIRRSCATNYRFHRSSGTTYAYNTGDRSLSDTYCSAFGKSTRVCSGTQETLLSLNFNSMPSTVLRLSISRLPDLFAGLFCKTIITTDEERSGRSRY